MVQEWVSVLILLPLQQIEANTPYGFTRHHQTRYDIPLLWTFDRLGTHENTVIGLQLNIGIQWHVQLLSSKQSERYDLKCKSSEYGEILEIHIGNVVKLE